MEVGRVVLINYGEETGKLATVIDIVDSKRVSAVNRISYDIKFKDTSSNFL